MRETFSSLIQRVQDLCVDDGSTTTNNLSTSRVFLIRELNNAIKDVFFLLKKYSLQPLPKTASTVSGQIWYHNPPGLSKIETVTMAVGSLVPPLRCIQSQEEWDVLHQVTLQSGYPIAYFPRRDDFGIYPTPNAAYTLTIVGNYTPVNLSQVDYNTGTVTATQNSTTLTGSGTAFTSSMVGRFFVLTDATGVPNGNWYRIAAYSSATSITLESYFEEATSAGATYLIGESPNLPEDLQEFLPYRAAGAYFASRRRDMEHSQQLLNYYYTGDFGNTNRRGQIRGGVISILQDLQENGRSNSQIAEMSDKTRLNNRLYYDVWGTTLS
jgi:hypothetical protein